jgi:hypothetical protein
MILQRSSSTGLNFLKLFLKKNGGGHPSAEKELHGFSIKYNYYDYIEAWSKVFLYQTALMDHSWFIAFDKKLYQSSSCLVCPLVVSLWFNP